MPGQGLSTSTLGQGLLTLPPCPTDGLKNNLAQHNLPHV
jgi:hypothetical protein